MKKTSFSMVAAFSVIFILSSCTSLVKATDSDTNEPAPGVGTTKSEYQGVSKPYTLHSLLLPVIQMNTLIMSIDYFDQFLEYNDNLFPDYLFRVLSMEVGGYTLGRGTVLSGQAIAGIKPFNLEKALISRDKEGNSWWKLQINFHDGYLSLEILSNKYNFPKKIRFIDKLSGNKYEIVPDSYIDFEDTMNEMSEDQIAAAAKKKIGLDIDKSFSTFFTNPGIIGEELIKTPAGRFLTVHVRDLISDSNWADYWLSPDVPGGIVRTSFTSNGSSESNITELMTINQSERLTIPDKDLTEMKNNDSFEDPPGNMEPGYSEGSSKAPIQLYPRETYYGSVGDLGTSYYKFNVDRRSDLFIEIEGMEGEAELVYFGMDKDFENWSTSSAGASLNVEDYMLTPGETVYFSVNDILDEYSVGKHFSIRVNQSFILDPIGIMMKGDIFNSAEELVSGRTYTLSAGSNGLDYYKTTVQKGPDLRIVILNEPDFGRLIWFDTENGTYSGMSSDWDQDSRTITIDGLAPGTVCYYYFSSDTDLLDPLQKLVLKITEQ